MQNETTTPLRRLLLVFFTSGFLLCFIGSLLFWGNVTRVQKKLVSQTQDKCFESFEQIRTTIENFTIKLKQLIDQWSSEIHDTDYSSEERCKKLFYLLQPYVVSLGVINSTTQSGYSLELNAKKKLQRVPYVKKDFIKKPWYQEVLKTQKAVWKVDVQRKKNINKTLTHPFLESAVLSYPLLKSNNDGSRETLVIALTVPFSMFEYIMRSTDVVDVTDTIMLWSDENKLMFHSDSKMLETPKSQTDPVFRLLGEWWTKFIFQMNVKRYIQQILKCDFFEPISIINYQRLGDSEWKLCLLYKGLIRLIDHEECYIFFKRAIFLGTLTLCFLFALLTLLTHKNLLLGYLYSLLSSISLVLLSVYMWDLQDKPYVNSQDVINIVQDSFQAQQYLNVLQIKKQRNIVANYAGVHIYHLHDVKSGEFEVGCMVWKIFDKEPAKEDEKFPFFLDSSWKYRIADPIVKKTENGWAIGWAAVVTLKTQCVFDKYPFDTQEIRLSFLLADAKDKIILPDFDGEKIFGFKNESAEKHIKMAYWKLEKPYYVYQSHKKGEIYDGELNFVLPIKRKHQSILYGMLLPIFFIFCILFAMLIHCGRTLAATKENVDQPLMPYISFAGGALLTNVIPHANLRALLGGMRSYAEFFYYIAYISIIMTLINCMIAHKPFAPYFIKYKYNIVARLCFWPMVFLMLAVATMVAF